MRSYEDGYRSVRSMTEVEYTLFLRHHLDRKCTALCGVLEVDGAFFAYYLPLILHNKKIYSQIELINKSQDLSAGWKPMGSKA